jgi:hypothetical protein
MQATTKGPGGGVKTRNNVSQICCLLSVVCCLLSVVCCLLSVVCCLLSVVCCLLSVVCCLLSVVCCRSRPCSCCSVTVTVTVTVTVSVAVAVAAAVAAAATTVVLAPPQTGELAFKRQLYQCMLGQALHMKSSMELHRSVNQFGTMIWQLGEIWPTGGWGSLEYGTPGMPGQVRLRPCCLLHRSFETFYNTMQSLLFCASSLVTVRCLVVVGSLCTTSL